MILPPQVQQAFEGKGPLMGAVIGTLGGMLSAIQLPPNVTPSLVVVMMLGSGALGGFFSFMPRYIRERAAAKIAVQKQLDDGIANLLERMTVLHASEMLSRSELHAEELRLLRHQVRRCQRMENLIRISKHNAVAALTDAELRLHNYEAFMSAHQLAYLESFGGHYAPADRRELFKEENAALLKMGTKDDAEEDET